MKNSPHLGAKIPKKLLVIIILIAISFGCLISDIKILPAGAGGEFNVTIMPDGSISPAVEFLQRSGDYYYFSFNVQLYLTVLRNNIVIDGKGYTISDSGGGNGVDISYRTNVTLENLVFSYGSGWGYYAGINLAFSNNCTIKGNNIKYCVIGINIESSNYSKIAENTIAGNGLGIVQQHSNYNLISDNDIRNTYYGISYVQSNNNIIQKNNIANHGVNGIEFDWSNQNDVFANNITNNGWGTTIFPYGIYVTESSENRFFHNNIVGNNIQVNVTAGYSNTWDNGYPSGGNYWSDYTGTDTNHDNLGDTPYIIDANNQDQYPFMNSYWYPPIPSFISLSVNPSLINLGDGTNLSGIITSPFGGDMSGTVYFQYSFDNINWNLVGSTSSNSSGEYSYWWVPPINGTFYVQSYWNGYWKGNSEIAGATSSSQTLVINVQQIFIKKDGSIVPQFAPISSVDNITYSLTSDTDYSIIVERDNIIIDGWGHTLIGKFVPLSRGLDLSGRKNVTAKNMNVGYYGYGIFLSGSFNITLHGNNIVVCDYGVYMFNSSSSCISDCVIKYPYYADIDLEDCNNNTIKGNTVGRSLDEGVWESSLGMVLNRSSNNTILQNSVRRKSAGISISSSSGNTILGNNLNNNEFGVGLVLISSQTNLVSGNTLFADGTGIHVKNSFGNMFFENYMFQNHNGMAFEGSSGNDVYRNNFTNNGGDEWGSGVQIMYSPNNRFYENNFVQNTLQQVRTSGSINSWYAGFPSRGNYWSDYTGTDANQDGIGDTPYVIDANNADNYPLMSPWVGALYAFLAVRGSDDSIYYRRLTSAPPDWGGWAGLPGLTLDSPAAAVCGNQLHFVVRGADGSSLWHGYVNLTTSAFSGWSALAGSSPSTPTLTSNGTHIAVVVRGGNDLIYYKIYSVASRSWGDWLIVPNGSTGDSLAASLVGNVLHIVVRGMEGNLLWYVSGNLDTNSWPAWNALAGTSPSPPTFAGNSTHLALVVRGSNSLIYYKLYKLASQEWDSWLTVPNGSTGDRVAAAFAGGSLQVAVRGESGGIIWHGSMNIDSQTFSGWTALDGSTPSAPTITS